MVVRPSPSPSRRWPIPTWDASPICASTRDRSSQTPTPGMRRAEDERLGQLFFARGKEHINTDVIGTGDIGAVAKLGSVMTGDTLCDQGKPIALAGVDFLARRTRPRSIPRPRPTSTRWDQRCNGWSRKIRRYGLS